MLAPNGAETIVGGSGYTVHWGASANAVTFTLAYSFGASSPWKVIDTGVIGTQYVWVIPETVPNHGDLFVAVIGLRQQWRGSWHGHLGCGGAT